MKLRMVFEAVAHLQIVPRHDQGAFPLDNSFFLAVCGSDNGDVFGIVTVVVGVIMAIVTA